jgi:rhodanese-related sulfurtransferase
MSTVKNMNVVDFGRILNSSDRSNYQIVDVREKDELLSMALPGSDVLNLPISDISSWSTQVLNGKLLDAEKPILCMCKLGGRSAKAATFFGESQPVE